MGMQVSRRTFLGCVSGTAMMFLAPPSEALRGGVIAVGASHADDVIPVSSLSPGNFSANAFSGFTSPASTVFTSVGSKYISPNPDLGDKNVGTTTFVARDSQCSTYFGRGAIVLRLNGPAGSQSCLFFSYNSAVTGGDIRVGIKTGYDAAQGFETTGTPYNYYANTNVAASAEGIAAGFNNSYTPGDLFTFGVQGFTVFLQWNGIDLLRYTEWRLMTAGQCSVWTHQSYGARDVTVHYPPEQLLFSNPSAGLYDTRDFGMRAVAAVTGTMSAGSNQLLLSSNVGFRVGDAVVVEIGGEAGAGLRSSVGVGGQWPLLAYADLAALNADTGKPNGTFAYLLTNNFVYSSVGGVWSRDTAGGGAFNQGYYSDLIVPLSLAAKVTAVSGNGLTLTLDKTAAVATAAANVWLDCKSSFFLVNQAAPVTAMFAPGPAGAVTLFIPTGDWRLSDIVKPASGFTVPQNGFTVKGAGKALTTLYSPKGITCGAINLLSNVANNTVISDMKYIGNLADNGFLFQIGGTTPNGFGGYPSAFTLSASAGITGLTLKNIDCVNPMGRAVGIDGGASPLIDTCTVTMQNGQQQYMGWQIQISNASGGAIQNCTGTGAFLLKCFEFFACNGTKIVNCGGQNVLYSTNSSTSWEIDCRGLTVNYTAGCFFNILSGWIDEAIFNVNDNAFGSGNTGTIRLGRHIQQGYIDASNNSLKFIQVATQTDVTVLGAYPGAGGCSTSLDGLLQAPNYDAGSAELGAMAVMSDTARTIVSGIRIKGTAIGSPGHSGHFGNISLLGTLSQVNNCVADVIQTGPTLSGNQTNAAYGGC